jgi:hypothetical protein
VKLKPVRALRQRCERSGADEEKLRLAPGKMPSIEGSAIRTAVVFTAVQVACDARSADADAPPKRREQLSVSFALQKPSSLKETSITCPLLDAMTARVGKKVHGDGAYDVTDKLLIQLAPRSELATRSTVVKETALVSATSNHVLLSHWHVCAPPCVSTAHEKAACDEVSEMMRVPFPSRGAASKLRATWRPVLATQATLAPGAEQAGAESVSVELVVIRHSEVASSTMVGSAKAVDARGARKRPLGMSTSRAEVLRHAHCVSPRAEKYELQLA